MSAVLAWENRATGAEQYLVLTDEMVHHLEKPDVRPLPGLRHWWTADLREAHVFTGARTAGRYMDAHVRCSPVSIRELF